MEAVGIGSLISGASDFILASIISPKATSSKMGTSELLVRNSVIAMLLINLFI